MQRARRELLQRGEGEIEGSGVRGGDIHDLNPTHLSGRTFTPPFDIIALCTHQQKHHLTFTPSTATITWSWIVPFYRTSPEPEIWVWAGGCAGVDRLTSKEGNPIVVF